MRGGWPPKGSARNLLPGGASRVPLETKANAHPDRAHHQLTALGRRPGPPVATSPSRSVGLGIDIGYLDVRQRAHAEPHGFRVA